MVTSTAEMIPGDHVCAIPESDEQLWELSADFVAGGLARNEQIVYFDDGTADSVLGRLAADRVPVAWPLRTGQLEIVPSELTRQVFERPVADARAAVLAMVDRAEAGGYAGFRLTGQWSSGTSRPGPPNIRDYDVSLDSIVRERSITLLCLYDRQRYSDAQIEELRGVHRDELKAPNAYDDGLLRITRTGPAGVRLAGEIDHSNRPVIARLLETALDDALRAPSAPTDIELNLASLRFLDVASAVGLVHAAEEFPSTHRLVLVGVQPRVVRVLDRCGALFAAQLDVREFDEPVGPGVAVGPVPVDPPDDQESSPPLPEAR